MQEEKRQRIWEKVNIGIFGVLVSVLGVLLLVLLSYYEQSWGLIQSNENHPLYTSVIQPVVSNIAIIMVVFGLGSLLLELYGYTAFFRKRLAEVFTDWEMLECISLDYKKKLRFNLLKSIYNPNSQDSAEILKLFDGRLGSIIEGLYYSEFEEHTHCSIIQDTKGNSCIRKKVLRKCVISEVNRYKNNSIEEFFRVNCQSLENVGGLKAFLLEKVEIDNRVLSEGKDYEIHSETNVTKSPYTDTYVCCLKEKCEVSGSLTMEIEYVTIVPMDDRYFYLRINRLCKSLKIYFQFVNSEYKIVANGFKFSAGDEQKVDIKYEDAMVAINSNGWLLPGEGVSLAIMEKRG